ncbi:MAG TPA: ribulose-phosphate 3-epimerase [Deltaproteobacteria bacterium]|jgi:ribulose-phosphate 3-epimerase|nr:ribulose-phosphate 3-epimerase [Deltaproteobacteria bacterium]HOI05715.1 ribulose-phosphate 3-epimerase [Deltaproteobacteria bacterium]
MILAPSILSADFSKLGDDIRTVVSAGAQWVHVDVMDGRFVPNITIGPLVVQGIRSVTDAYLDCHLMIEDPDRYLEAFARAGANGITVHVEACTHLHRTLTRIRELGCKAGVSLNPATGLETLEYCLDCIDLILVMSVNPGFGGQSFINAALPKIRKARSLCEGRDILIQVDGGIGKGNLRTVLDAGADSIVAGSSVFSSPDPGKTVKEMFDIANRSND